MSNAHSVAPAARQQPVRVREQAREAAAVFLFSAAAASCLALLLVLLASLGQQG